MKIPPDSFWNVRNITGKYDRGACYKNDSFPATCRDVNDQSLTSCIVLSANGWGRSRGGSIFDDFFGNSVMSEYSARAKSRENYREAFLPEAGKRLGFSGMVGTLAMITSMSTTGYLEGE